MNTRNLGKFVRLFASDKDGEVVAAVRALGRMLAKQGADFHALAELFDAGMSSSGSRSHASPGEAYREAYRQRHEQEARDAQARWAEEFRRHNTRRRRQSGFNLNDWE
jgi:hypothetical protein